MQRIALIAASVGALAASSLLQASDLFGIEFSGPTDLFSINQSSGVVSSIGPTGKDNLGDLTSDTRAGSERIWGVRIASNELYQFNPLTGAAGPAVTLNSPNPMVSIAFDPVGGKLYGNTSAGFGAPFDALYEIDPVTGNSTFIGRILFENVYALGFSQSGKLFGVSDATDDFISIDLTSGNGTFITDLPVGFAFDIASRPEDDVMFLADSGTFSLYTVDTTSGALNPVGGYGSTPNVVGLAFLPSAVIPESSTHVAAGILALGVAGTTIARRRRQA